MWVNNFSHFFYANCQEDPTTRIKSTVESRVVFFPLWSNTVFQLNMFIVSTVIFHPRHSKTMWKPWWTLFLWLSDGNIPTYILVAIFQFLLPTIILILVWILNMEWAYANSQHRHEQCQSKWPVSQKNPAVHFPYSSILGWKSDGSVNEYFFFNFSSHMSLTIGIALLK